MKKIRRIGLIVHAFEGEYLPRFKAGIQAYARRDGHWRLVETSRMRSIPSVARDVEGIISHVSDLRYAKLIAATGLPCVNVSQNLRSATLPAIRTDDRLVGHQAADYFLKRAYRHFAFLGSSLGPTGARRQAAFVSKIQQAGFDVALCQKPRTQDIARIRKDIGKWLAKLPHPTALFTSNDVLGITALDACLDFGIAVPTHIAVLSTGNVHTITRYSHPPLSSISVNVARRGFAAAEMLDRLIKGEKIQHNTLLIPPGRTITRQSSDAFAIEDPVTRDALRFIYEHACDPATVDDAANALDITRRSLERKFQEHLYTSPHHEIRRIRMERAQNLLMETQLSIAQVAFESGMGNAENLWDAFKQLLNQSPSEYRKLSQAHFDSHD
jgi:LacI family transcriptional regulator